MKTIFALPLLALGLAACQTYPPGPGYTGQGPVGYPEPYPPAYGQPGDYGMPNQGQVTLSGTNWTVVAINGRSTPRANFYMNFQPDRIGAKFGCNSLGAGYSVTGSTLSAGAVMATRMACPDMSFEDQGSAVLAQPMQVSGAGDDLTLSNRAGTIALRRAR